MLVVSEPAPAHDVHRVSAGRGAAEEGERERTENAVGLHLDLLDRERRAVRVFGGDELGEDVAAYAIGVAGLLGLPELVETERDGLARLLTERSVAGRAEAAREPPVQDSTGPRLSACESQSQ